MGPLHIPLASSLLPGAQGGDRFRLSTGPLRPRASFSSLSVTPAAGSPPTGMLRGEQGTSHCPPSQPSISAGRVLEWKAPGGFRGPSRTEAQLPTVVSNPITFPCTVFCLTLPPLTQPPGALPNKPSAPRSSSVSAFRITQAQTGMKSKAGSAPVSLCDDHTADWHTWSPSTAGM